MLRGTIYCHEKEAPLNKTPVLHIDKVSKAYPGVQALHTVDYDLYAGEVHGLVGENGAGKSTLIEILAGSIRPDSGDIVVDQEVFEHLDPGTSIELGIQTVHQDNQLVEALSVAENIFLYDLKTTNAGFFSLKDCVKETSILMESLGIDIDPGRKIEQLTPVEKKIVSITKAFSRQARILILDEPTAALDEQGKEILFSVIKDFTNKDLSVIYISHNLGEVFEICNRVTVLKDGKKINTHSIEDIDVDALISEMIGRSTSSFYHREASTDISQEGEECLEVSAYSREGVVNNVTFTVRRGEIFGLGGMVGSGRTELARMIFGLDQRDSGTLIYNGKDISPDSPFEAIRNGIGLLTEDRAHTGLVLDRPIYENISLVELGKNFQLMLDLPDEKKQTGSISKRLNIVTPSLNQMVRNLSGGNQQKVVLAKWLFANTDIVIFDEPTIGIDVGAKSEIYNLMHELAEAGKIIIMISSDTPELTSVSDRVGIMRAGELVKILEGEEISEENVLKHSIGSREKSRS
jgi:ribose transport system ATP-binding protein